MFIFKASKRLVQRLFHRRIVIAMYCVVGVINIAGYCVPCRRLRPRRSVGASICITKHSADENGRVDASIRRWTSDDAFESVRGCALYICALCIVSGASRFRWREPLSRWEVGGTVFELQVSTVPRGARFDGARCEVRGASSLSVCGVVRLCPVRESVRGADFEVQVFEV